MCRQAGEGGAGSQGTCIPDGGGISPSAGVCVCVCVCVCVDRLVRVEPPVQGSPRRGDGGQTLMPFLQAVDMHSSWWRRGGSLRGRLKFAHQTSAP